MSKDIPTQAVIFIHGIGEQLPMSTLRSFVHEVLPEHEDGIKFFSRPDSISDTYELRILQNRKRPRTHFFEYYWAYKIEGTNFGHIFSWLKTLLLRSPMKVNNQMLPLWLISWILLFFTALAFGLGWIDEDFFKFSGLMAVLFSAVQGYVLTWAGDAARYLSPTPQNIRLRQNIRKDGIDLVKKIVETGKYDRIIIVGHSLGSVIGYDILTHLWQEYNQKYEGPRQALKIKTQDEIKKMTKKRLQPALAAVEGYDTQQLMQNPGMVDAYQDDQKGLFLEIRSMGNPWLITDFITLGSPLTHAIMLLAADEQDLKQRQMERELPTNPPVKEPDDNGPVFSYKSWYDFEYGRKKFKPWILHHAASFAFTRWTNLYFPVKIGLLGDLVGGPLRPWFGGGIKDIPVSTGKWWKDNTLAAHSSYWPSGRTKTGIEPYLQHLLDALDLDDKDFS